VLTRERGIYTFMRFHPLIFQQYHILRWISLVFFWDLSQNECHQTIDLYFQTIDKWVKESGPVWTIKRMKILRNHITRYITKDPLLVSSDKIGLTPDGFPKSYIYLKDYVDSGAQNKLRFVMTLLTLSRSFDVKGTVNLSSITDPFKGSYQTIDRIFIQRFVTDHRIDLTHDGFSWKSLFFTFKGGTHGKQLWTAFHSLLKWNGVMHACARLLGSTSWDQVLDI